MRWLDANGHEFEQTLVDGEGQGSLVCCSPWVIKSWTRLSYQITIVTCIFTTDFEVCDSIPYLNSEKGTCHVTHNPPCLSRSQDHLGSFRVFHENWRIFHKCLRWYSLYVSYKIYSKNLIVQEKNFSARDVKNNMQAKILICLLINKRE